MSRPRQITTDLPFAIVPEWVLDAGVSSRAVHVYAVLSRHADGDGKCFPSRRKLAERCRCSVDVVDRAVNELIAIEALRREHKVSDRGDYVANEWTVCRIPGQGVAAKTRLPADTRRPGRENAATGGREYAAPKNENHLEREPLNEKNTLPDVAEATPVRRRDMLWEAVLDGCGITGPLTPSARGAYNRAVADLRSVGAEPTDVPQRVANYRTLFGDCALTPTALAKHWAQCAAPAAGRPPQRRSEPKGAQGLRDYLRIVEGQS